MSILTEIIEILVGGITGVAEGVGSGLQALASNIFLDTTGGAQTLSVMGTLIVVFAGIGLAIGLSKFVLYWVASLGASK